MINIEKNDKENYISQSFSPINFKNTFVNLHPQFSTGQNDAIEFIRILLDDISKETRRNKNIDKYEELNLDDKSKEEQSFEYNKFFFWERKFYNNGFILHTID